MRNDKIRMVRQELKKVIPKKVNVTASDSIGFCKYGRVQGSSLQSEAIMVVPINGNQNNNWKVG